VLVASYAACSILRVLTQWGATLVIIYKERESATWRCGAREGGAARECSRLIGVAQPLASAWLQAIPGPSQFRLRSSLYVVARGLPIHMASAANVAAAETLGDELLKGCEHAACSILRALTQWGATLSSSSPS
jgi:hypothetical protein